jgi:Methyltransferase domain
MPPTCFGSSRPRCPASHEQCSTSAARPESSPAAAGIETIAGFAEDVDLGDRTYDLILLCQTIDHLLDIGATLRSIRRWVADEGRVFVDVLDVEFMMLRRGSIEGAVKIDHPFALTRATALAYFTKAGLRPTAERLSDDGHLGFLLEPVAPADPDWSALHVAAEDFLRLVWRLRAGG